MVVEVTEMCSFSHTSCKYLMRCAEVRTDPFLMSQRIHTHESLRSGKERGDKEEEFGELEQRIPFVTGGHPLEQ